VTVRAVEPAVDHVDGEEAHPLGPVLQSVARVANGAPLASIGADETATWHPASCLADPDGPVLTRLLDDAARRWGLGPHAAAALAFKGYAWAATLPVVVGWLLHQRVPLLDAARVRVGIADDLPYVRFDLAGASVGVLRGDPAAAHPSALAVDDPAALLAAAKAALVDDHLAGVITALDRATRVGERLLWGSVAEAIAQPALIWPAGTVADPVATSRRLIDGFGEHVADLVEIVDDPGRPRVQRRTCCLWFTGGIGRGRYCASCCVTRR